MTVEKNLISKLKKRIGMTAYNKLNCRQGEIIDVEVQTTIDRELVAFYLIKYPHDVKMDKVHESNVIIFLSL